MQRPHILSHMRQMQPDSVKEPFAAGKGFAHKGPLDKPHLQEAYQLQLKPFQNISPFFPSHPGHELQMPDCYNIINIISKH